MNVAIGKWKVNTTSFGQNIYCEHFSFDDYVFPPTSLRRLIREWSGYAQVQGDRPEIQREADYAQRILYVICVLLNGEGYEATWNELVAYVSEVEGVREV